MNELVHQPELATEIGETTPVSWTAPAEMTYEQWESIGLTLQQVGRSLNWWLGDWLNQGEARYGEMYTQAMEMTGQAVETLSKYKSVAARLPAEIRNPALSWTSHFAVAYAPEELRGPLLELAARFNLPSRELKDIMRLKPPQLEELIDACADEEMTLQEFTATVNQVRLHPPAHTIVRGHAEPPSHTQAPLVMEPEPDVSFAPTPLPAKEVYLEEIFDFFDGVQAFKVRTISRTEASWGHLTVRAALDEAGKPYLIWETQEDDA